MKSLISKLIEIAFSEMKEKIKVQQETIDRQNEILIEMDKKMDAIEQKVIRIEKSNSDDDFDVGNYKYGIKGGNG